MRYSVIHDMNHPRLCEDLSGKNIIYYDISDSHAETLLLKNLMKEILDPSKHKNIRIVFEDFLKSRTLDRADTNHTVQRIEEFFKVYEKHYNNKTGFNFYLVEREGNKIVDIHRKWKCKRENPFVYTGNRKNKKRVNI